MTKSHVHFLGWTHVFSCADWKAFPFLGNPPPPHTHKKKQKKTKKHAEPPSQSSTKNVYFTLFSKIQMIVQGFSNEDGMHFLGPPLEWPSQQHVWCWRPLRIRTLQCAAKQEHSMQEKDSMPCALSYVLSRWSFMLLSCSIQGLWEQRMLEALVSLMVSDGMTWPSVILGDNAFPNDSQRTYGTRPFKNSFHSELIFLWLKEETPHSEGCFHGKNGDSPETFSVQNFDLITGKTRITSKKRQLRTLTQGFFWQ